MLSAVSPIANGGYQKTPASSKGEERCANNASTHNDESHVHHSLMAVRHQSGTHKYEHAVAAATAARWTLVATILGSSLTFIDGTIVNVALPALQADLQATITDVQWVIEAYALFLGALILVGGSMGDQFG